MADEGVTDDAGKVASVKPGRSKITNRAQRCRDRESVNKSPIGGLHDAAVNMDIASTGLTADGGGELKDIGIKIAKLM
jgi:hypothetical protein